MKRRKRWVNLGLFALGLLIVSGAAAAGAWWEATKERTCVCAIWLKKQGYGT